MIYFLKCLLSLTQFEVHFFSVLIYFFFPFRMSFFLFLFSNVFLSLFPFLISLFLVLISFSKFFLSFYALSWLYFFFFFLSFFHSFFLSFFLFSFFSMFFLTFFILWFLLFFLFSFLSFFALTVSVLLWMRISERAIFHEMQQKVKKLKKTINIWFEQTNQKTRQNYKIFTWVSMTHNVKTSIGK